MPRDVVERSIDNSLSFGLFAATEDAHELYERYGFERRGDDPRVMGIWRTPGDLYGA